MKQPRKVNLNWLTSDAKYFKFVQTRAIGFCFCFLQLLLVVLKNFFWKNQY